MQKKGMKIMKFYFQTNLSCIYSFFVVPLYPNLVVVHIIHTAPLILSETILHKINYGRR